MTELNQKLDASCRLAFAAYLHDLGKLAERARIQEAEDKDVEGTTLAERNKQLYCPQWDHRFTHVHAAYTAIAIDLIEQELPPLIGEEVSPFAAWKAVDVDDSLINAAAMHHKPETALQWIIATADRLASGFEREEFDDYNRAEDKTATGKSHYTARQYTLFEQIQLSDSKNVKEPPKWRYPLEAMSVAGLFPKKATDCEGNNKAHAQKEYKEIWQGFRDALKNIPESHRNNWSLWLDHFDTLWATFAHAIPSATAGKTKPDVSLYDHSRTTAALATALWRYHEHDPDSLIQEQLRAQWDRKRQHQELADLAWGSEKYLLILGDFFGIQDFIFATGGETQRNAAKLLRGRSFYVSLLTECAALKILDELGLPPTSQVINAAGKFLIVAPNTEEVKSQLKALQSDIDRWFLDKTYGVSGIGIAWEAACGRDFLHEDQQAEPPFRKLINHLFHRVEDMKARRLSLCNVGAPPPVFDGFLSAFDNTKGVCAIDGRSPASERLPKAENRHVSRLALDQINVGTWLSHHDRLLITTKDIEHHTLALDIFGYHISFTGKEAASGKFGALAREGQLRRAWDYALPEKQNTPLYSGYGRRAINAYVPMMGDPNSWEADRYKNIEEDSEWDSRAPKTFEHIARDDLWLDETERWNGTEALMVLKGDVDNLGSIFEKGLEKPSFAKWSSLSRQMNAFFSLYLPWLCKEKYPSTYTVFAGGDDFFLIGPWKSTILLAREMREEFTRYVADNQEIHFSTGLLMTKPGIPVRQLGDMSEAALEQSKSMPGKDAVTLFGQTIAWHQFDQLWKTFEEIDREHREMALSTGYLYRLQDLAYMSANLKTPQPRPENAIWRAWFSYRTWRMLEQTLRGKDKEAERRRRMGELAKILSEPIEQFGTRFLIPLFIHLYQHRS